MVLQAIRERLTGILAIFIFAILIIPFAFVGVNSYFASDAVNSVARVNDVDITTTEFSTGFQNYRRRMQSILGEQFDPEQFDQPIIRRQFLDSMIDQELVAQVSAQIGLTVDDETLAAAIRNYAIFQVEGVFNPDVYQQRLESQGSSPQQFEIDVRAQLLLDQLPDAITSSAISTDAELARFIAVQDQQRSFKAIVVEAQLDELIEELAAEGAVDEAVEEIVAEAEVEAEALAEAASDLQTNAEELVDEGLVDAQDAGGLEEEAIQAWYDQHPELFRSEEQVTIEYIELNAAIMEQDIAPDDDQLRARFDEQKARFITPEARLASHILIEVAPDADDATIETTRQTALDLERRIKAGEDFDALAIEYSQDAGSAPLGGDLGWVEPGFMVQAFEDGLYALSLENPISEPIQTGFGWHVIELREVRAAEGMSFEEAREILLSESLVESQERKFIEQADRMVDLVYEDPTTLSTAAEVLELEVQETGPFGRAGGTGIAANQAIVTAAFSDLVLQQASVSDPVDLGDNHMVMLRLKEYKPEDLKPLDEVRADVIAGVRRDHAMQLASERVEALREQLQSGADIAELAAAESLEVLEGEALTRIGSGIPGDLLVQVFLLPRPQGEEPLISTVPLGNGYAVVQLDSVTDGVVSEDDLLRMQNYKRRIANATANAEVFGLIRLLRSQSEIEVYEDRL